MRLIVFILLQAWLVRALTCTTRDGIVPSVPGVLCAECQFDTYVDNVTLACAVNSTTSTTTTTLLADPCDWDQYRECQSSNGTCVRSQRGVLCKVCSNLGYLKLSSDLKGKECECYTKALDPSLGCQPGVFFTPTSTLVDVQLTFTQVYCESYQHDMLGYYFQEDHLGHKFGTPDPPVPYRCFNDIYGPPPGELREVLIAGQPLQTCNTYGGPDPNLAAINDTTFYTCHGHGLFNLTTRECTCDRGWALELVGENVHGDDVFSCTQCVRHYGPDPIDPTRKPPYCVGLYAPDPLTGVDEECSGHGTFYPATDGTIHGNCVCYSNATTQWTLGQIGVWEDDGITPVKSCVIQE